MELPRTIALLELTGDGLTINDIAIKNTLEYYWRNYPDEFKSFPIINTQSSIELTLQFLEFYYKAGYRFFYGFSRSSVLSAVLDWFNFHPDAVGFSSVSFTPELSIPKKIYRMSPIFTDYFKPISKQLQDANAVFYLYTLGEAGPESEKVYLEQLLAQGKINQLYTYGVTSTNLTVDDVNNFFISNNLGITDIVLFNIFDRNSYINLYNQGLSCSAQQYDISPYQPAVIKGEAAFQLKDKYNAIVYTSTCTSIIWRAGYNTLGVDSYSAVTLNVINLLNSLVTLQDTDNVNSHSGVLQFDPVTRDIVYPSFIVEKFNGTKYVTIFLYVEDPYLGNFTAVFQPE
jgi:hypothetical protein